jgi:hypothetical protein
MVLLVQMHQQIKRLAAAVLVDQAVLPDLQQHQFPHLELVVCMVEVEEVDLEVAQVQDLALTDNQD